MITIIGILIALLLPAVQAAREAARRVQCTNNLKQISLAMLTHEQAIGWLPAGGWGFGWVGDPDAGLDRKQPGGWVFNMLPYMEQQPLHDLAAGLQAGSVAKKTALQQMCGTPLVMLSCPTRRPAQVYPTSALMNMLPVGSSNQFMVPPLALKSDYAGNGGDGPWSSDSGYPTGNTITSENTETGVYNQRSTTKLRDITDGTSNTYMVGEKYINADYYFTGQDNSDDQTAYLGYDIDINRWTKYTPGDPAATWTPQQDQPGTMLWHNFGSAHAISFNMAFCDGSVQFFNYSIDPETHRRLGNRKDGAVIDGKKF